MEWPHSGQVVEVLRFKLYPHVGHNPSRISTCRFREEYVVSQLPSRKTKKNPMIEAKNMWPVATRSDSHMKFTAVKTISSCVRMRVMEYCRRGLAGFSSLRSSHPTLWTNPSLVARQIIAAGGAAAEHGKLTAFVPFE